MSSKSAALPDFESPPVVEIVIGVSFKDLKNFTTAHYGIFWQQIKEDYPLFEDHPPLIDPVSEPGRLHIETLDNLPLRRVFFVHSQKDYLLQLQPNRFVHNWRKMDEDSAYPHFPAAKERFFLAWTEFQQFLGEEELGPIQMVQFEVTYINHFIEEPGNFPQKAEYYTPLIDWKNSRSTNFLPIPTALSYNINFPLPDDKGTLNVTSKHGTRNRDKKDVMILELRARGPIKGNENSLEHYFELGHEWIVRGFKDITSPEAHKQWKIIR